MSDNGPNSEDAPSIAVVGSVNLDLVATVPRLPNHGETVAGTRLDEYPGGKGANQALAARRLGAQVSLIASVGEDAAAQTALALLSKDGVDLSGCIRQSQAPTGRAFISVSPEGENQIVVIPGANGLLTPDQVQVPVVDGILCQLETPPETVAAVASANRDCFFAINVSPVIDFPELILSRADLVVVNEAEYGQLGSALDGCECWIAVTYGAEGAQLLKAGEMEITAGPPPVDAVDTTGAGDTFSAALALRLMEGCDPYGALQFACAAGALATTKAGAQPSFPWRHEVESFMAGEQKR